MPRQALLVLLLAASAAAADPLSRGPHVFPVPHVGEGISRRLAFEAPVSPASPFPFDCGLSTGVMYLNAEVEPSLAVDPRDARHWIAAWQQDRWSNGSSRGIVTAATFDAGITWTRAVPRYTACSGGPYARASDPWVDISPDGTAWLIALLTTGTSFTPASVNAVVVSRSTDGGLSWSEPATLIRDTGATFFNDKETITADPLDAHYAYAVWDRLQGNARGPTYFSRTTDGGATWEAARSIHDPGAGQQTIGNLVRVLPDGTLVNLFTQLAGGADDDDKALKNASLQVLRSTDRGATWTGPFVVAAYQPQGASDPATHLPIRDGTPIAAMAVGADGALFVAWQDGRMSPVAGRDDILLARSDDGGLAWSSPVRVNGVPGATAFAPQVDASPDGTIAVTYFDLRSDIPDSGTLLADYWMARSRDGVTWTESHLAGPFDLLGAPLAGGYFLGDYMGLAHASGQFLALHVRTTGNPDNPTDVFVARQAIAAPGVAYVAPPAKAAREDPLFTRRVSEALKAALARRAIR